MTNLRLFPLLALALALPTLAAGQTLEQRVASARGSVGFEFDTRSNVCGDGHSIMVSNDSSPGWTRRSSRSGVHIGRRKGRSGDCETGPARVLIEREGNAVANLRVTVGGMPASAETELGRVSASDAAAYLLSIAPRLTGESADDAIMGAQIANGARVWDRLLEIARDNGATESARKSALFWVSHEASIAATSGLGAVAADDDASIAVRKDALFYLAQRPNGEGVPALARVAETSTSSRLRKDAIFYLAQSRDPRALDVFERLLTKR